MSEIAETKYSAGQINVLKGCASRGFNHATFDHFFSASRVNDGERPKMFPRFAGQGHGGHQVPLRALRAARELRLAAEVAGQDPRRAGPGLVRRVVGLLHRLGRLGPVRHRGRGRLRDGPAESHLLQHAGSVGVQGRQRRQGLELPQEIRVLLCEHMNLSG